MIKAAAILMVIAATPAFGQSSVPNPQLTPGALNSDVTQENIDQTICVRGWTRTIRPDEKYTYERKKFGVWQYGYPRTRLGDFEEDHFIPLGLGGHPTDARNLWPEPRIAADGWRADDKDLLETTLNRMVCQRQISLQEAQAAIAVDWREAYTRFVTNRGQ